MAMTTTTINVLLLLALLSVSSSLAAPSPAEDDHASQEREINDVSSFVSKGGDVTVAPGESIRLKCRVKDLDPNIIIMWSKQNVILSLGEAIHDGDGARRYRVRQLDDGVDLSVDEATEADSGPYKCKIMVKGSKEIVYNVRVGYFPDEKTTTEASSVGDGGGAAANAASSVLAVLLPSILLVLMAKV